MTPGSKKAALSVGVVVLLIGTFFLGRVTAPDGRGPQVAVVDPNMTSAGPERVPNGVPLGYARTEEGALQAAINFSRALAPDPGESKAAYSAKLESIASSRWDGLASTIQSFEEGSADVAPMRYLVKEFSPDQAEIGLWFVSYVNPANGAPGELWGRSLLTLVWEEGDWKVSSEDGDLGPTPSPLADPDSSGRLSDLLRGYTPIAFEPSNLR